MFDNPQESIVEKVKTHMFAPYVGKSNKRPSSKIVLTINYPDGTEEDFNLQILDEVKMMLYGRNYSSYMIVGTAH